MGLHAYVSPPGAPGHDIVAVTPEGIKSNEVKTRQYIDSPSEISRWPVDMGTKADADYFLFVELALRTLKPTFFLLGNAEAKATHKDYQGSGNCLPKKVRAAVTANDFSALTGEPMSAAEPRSGESQPKPATNGLRRRIAQEAEFGGKRIVQYTCHSIDVFVDGALQNNAIENLRKVAEKIGVSEYNASGGARNTRQLGLAVIEAIKERK